MARIIRSLQEGNVQVVAGVSKSLAQEVYDELKKTNEQLAIYFMEQWRYCAITGRLMS
jgi:hypothetical protein